MALTAHEYDENEYENDPVKSKPFILTDIVGKPVEQSTKVKFFTMEENFLESDDKLLSLGFF